MTLETIWTPGRTGWQGRQGSKTSLVVLAVFMGAAVIGYAAILLTESSTPFRLQGAVVILSGALGAWILAAHMRISRVRVVQVLVEPARLTFGRPRGILLPLRLLGIAGALLLAAWVWSLSATSSDRIPVLSLLLTPIVALCMIYGGVSSFFNAGSRVVLEPERLQVVIPRTGLTATWDEVAESTFASHHVVIVLANARQGGWAARDFASDPVVLAELIRFYARAPSARAEIGEAALARLREGAF